MNANEISKPGSRLSRIKTVSRIFRALIIGYALLCVLLYLALAFGWIGVIPGITKIQFSSHQIYTWPFDIPKFVLALALIKFGFIFWCIYILNRLLALYEKGNFFTAKNVLYIRFLGYFVVINWIVNLFLDLESHQVEIFFTQPLIGFAIIFIAWIMDE
ncbi:MAG: DUF2975 domain-containing protein, partial [Verrucomicrobiota bacterium]